MLNVTLETLGPEWSPVYWQGLEDGFRRDLATLIGLWVQRLVAEAKRRAAVDTGNLRSSITGQVFVNGDTVLGVIGTNVPYGPYVEFGTGLYSTWPGAPHRRITPQAAKALRWTAGGAVFFARSIAGAHPQPFLTPLLDEFGAEIQADLVALAAKHGFR